MNFQVTVLKILVSYPDGFAVMADLKRDMAILATSGQDWAERTKRLFAKRALRHLGRTGDKTRVLAVKDPATRGQL
ncbi:hypothetical protein [Bradyrhizobium sp. PRIMUS42]|uniref:hypothetical protein n=1 Tax=Bradyrhizobium sp. PRIMUS42 TaxID=2908926 RepID=UPI001FF48622|nr:hypothetical protein [Bradyrhizobium sp. PRIMUS42]MCJ9728628.1 hypothetical protein [Bradyrhizobium sp. PRIMUS42]